MYGDFDVKTGFIAAGGYLVNFQHIEWINRPKIRSRTEVDPDNNFGKWAFLDCESYFSLRSASS